MPPLIDQSIAQAGNVRALLWSFYLAAAVILPICHVRPILCYMRGNNGIGDACVRTEAFQCLWRVPALLYSMFEAPSLPLFLSISLDLLGRIGRVLAMHASRRRWHAIQRCRLLEPDPDLTGKGSIHVGSLPVSRDQGLHMQHTIRTRTRRFDAATAWLARGATAGINALRAARHAVTDAFSYWRRAQWHQCEGEWLDDRTLRDLGLDRSERTSYLAESSGIAAPTRRRVAAVRPARSA
jgi:hypothetical protein